MAKAGRASFGDFQSGGGAVLALVAAKQHETGQSLAEAIGETDEEVDFHSPG